jgi:trimeric autotransporter adhesin
MRSQRGAGLLSNALRDHGEICTSRQMAGIVRLTMLLFGLPALGLGQTSEEIAFTYQIGGSVPAAVHRDLYSQPSVTVTLVPDGAGWVSATVSNPSTPCVLTISVVPGTLQAGRYTSTLRVNSSQGYLLYNISLDVSGGSGSGGLALSSSSFTFNAYAGGATPASQTLTVTAPSTVSASAQASQQNCTGSNWLTLSPSGSFTAGTTGTAFTISVNPSGLTAGTACTGSISITAASVTQTASVTLNVAATSGGPIVSPASLTFNAVAGASAPPSQTLTVTAQSNTSASAQVSKQSCVGSDWLTVSPAGDFMATTTGAALSVSVNPYAIAAGTTCTGSIAVTAGSVTQTTSVTLNVAGITSGDFTVSASILTFSAGAGAPAPGGVTVYVTASAAISAFVQASQQSCSNTVWLSVTPAGSIIAGSVATPFTVSVNHSGMAVGTVCNGTVTITTGTTTKLIPVTLTVIRVPSGSLTLKPSSLTFSAVAGGADPPSQTLAVTAPFDTNASVKVSQQSCGGAAWLSISPTGSFTASLTDTTLTVSVSPSRIPAGSTCLGTVSVTSSSGYWDATVTLKVAAPVSTQLTFSPSSFTFSASAGGAAPAPQTLTVSAQTGVGTTATALAQTCTGSNWLYLSPSGSFTAGTASTNFTVAVDQSELSPGAICTGAISLVTNSAAQTLPVTLVVTSPAPAKPTLSATPTTISFTHQAGNPGSTLQIVSVSGGGAPGTISVSTSRTAWLRVSPSCTAALPCSVPNSGTLDLQVTADPNGMNAGVTDYATISIEGVGQTTGTANVGVSFTRTAPAPVITLVTNAASYLTGPVSPGEMIAIFAKPANPIGPETAMALNGTTCPAPCTAIPTTIGGVQVIFQPGSVPAPLTYVSSTQVNCMVPYEILGAEAVEVQVIYLGQKSNSVTLQYAATQPAIFTALGTGTGLASALQYDEQGRAQGQNSSSNPASPGWVISFYATGEGIIQTPAVTGKVTVGRAILPLMGPPSVWIDNLPATVTYFAESDGFVSGVMQVNSIIPAAVHTGKAVSLSLAMDGRYSQPGVVLYLKEGANQSVSPESPLPQ